MYSTIQDCDTTRHTLKHRNFQSVPFDDWSVNTVQTFPYFHFYELDVGSCFRYVVPPIWMSLIPISLVLISSLQFVWLCRRMTKRVSSQIWTQHWLVRDCWIMASDYLRKISHIPPLIQRWLRQLGAKSPYSPKKKTQDQIQERINRLRVSEVCVLKYDSHRHQKSVPNLFC